MQLWTFINSYWQLFIMATFTFVIPLSFILQSGDRTICCRTNRSGQNVADNSSHRQMVAGQTVEEHIITDNSL